MFPGPSLSPAPSCRQDSWTSGTCAETGGGWGGPRLGAAFLVSSPPQKETLAAPGLACPLRAPPAQQVDKGCRSPTHSALTPTASHPGDRAASERALGSGKGWRTLPEKTLKVREDLSSVERTDSLLRINCLGAQAARDPAQAAGRSPKRAVTKNETGCEGTVGGGEPPSRGDTPGADPTAVGARVSQAVSGRTAGRPQRCVPGIQDACSFLPGEPRGSLQTPSTCDHVSLSAPLMGGLTWLCSSSPCDLGGFLRR